VTSPAGDSASESHLRRPETHTGGDLSARTNPAMLLAFVASVVASVVAVLVASALVLELLMRRGPLPVPHPLFYLVSVTLPYHWRTGFLFVPFLMLVSGSAARLTLAPASRRRRLPRAR
jgi:hypothetical protein